MVCGSYKLGQTGLMEPFVRGRRQGIIDQIEVIEFDLSYSNEYGLLKRSALFLRYAWAAVKIAMRSDYDLAFATTTPLTAGIPGIFARWLRRKPFVFEVRDLWPELPREMGIITNPIALAAMSALEWLSYHSANRCVALAPGIARGIARRGIRQRHIAIIPNGCDLDILAAGEPWRPATVRESDFLAVFAGTHGVANGLSSVVDAAELLQKRGRGDIKLLLIGDGKLKVCLMAEVHRRGIKNIVFHDPVPKRRLAGLFAASDLGLQILANVPAFYDGTSPNKFFDYIAAGLPVLNNYPGWLAEMLSEYKAGIAVPPDDPGAFADALESAADNGEALRQMSDNAAKLARKFDRATLGESWVAWVTEGRRV
jgi:glycosyltransferase involved in cell wall biosynthesis